MTAKEKAKELVRKYYNFVSGWTSTNRPDENPSAQYEGEKMKIGRAKQCAIIAVENECNSLRELLFDLRSSRVIESEKVYLTRLQNLIDKEKQIRQEIEKL